MAERDSSTRRRLLEALKCGGPRGIADLVGALERTPVAVRRLLGRLRTGELVEFEERCEGVGRPAQIWRLTPKGHALFDDRHGTLASGLLSAVRAVHGEDGVRRVLEERARQQCDDYRERLRGVGGALRERVGALSELRSRDGYMAEFQACDDGTFLLIENHCPIAEAAMCCGGVCDAELGLFQTVLGLDVDVRREEHQREGDRRCTYRIRRLTRSG